jgi:hypothetical protein
MKKIKVEKLDYENISVVVLAHNRTSHLLSVLSSLEVSYGFHSCKLIFACDRPSRQVQSIVQGFSHPNKVVLINEKAPLTVAQAINMNLFEGLSQAFGDTTTQIVIVLEDDIVVSPDSILFTLEIFQKFSTNSYFRGLNLFSRIVPDVPNSNRYVIGNFGLGWGWAISRTTFEKFRTFWHGREDNHWDFIIEPFCRTGFVVNPIKSRIMNIGMDDTATHTRDKDAVELSLEISRSFQGNCSRSIAEIFGLSTREFLWKNEYYQFRVKNRSSWIALLLINNLIFAIFKSETGKNRATMALFNRLRKLRHFFGLKASS